MDLRFRARRLFKDVAMVEQPGQDSKDGQFLRRVGGLVAAGPIFQFAPYFGGMKRRALVAQLAVAGFESRRHPHAVHGVATAGEVVAHQRRFFHANLEVGSHGFGEKVELDLAEGHRARCATGFARHEFKVFHDRLDLGETEPGFVFRRWHDPQPGHQHRSIQFAKLDLQLQITPGINDKSRMAPANLGQGFDYIGWETAIEGIVDKDPAVEMVAPMLDSAGEVFLYLGDGPRRTDFVWGIELEQDPLARQVAVVLAVALGAVGSAGFEVRRVDAPHEFLEQALEGVALSLQETVLESEQVSELLHSVHGSPTSPNYLISQQIWHVGMTANLLHQV